MSIGKSSIQRAASTAASTTTKKNVVMEKQSVLNMPIEIKDIKYLSDNYNYDEALIKKFASSIKNRGVLTPVLVARTNKGDVWLVDGGARVKAAERCGLSVVPASIVELENKKEVLKLFRELAALSRSYDDIREAKFSVISTEKDDMPVYLL